MKIIMDGKEVAAESGQTILQVARANGIFIPTLCYSPALEAAAMCRLCTVELIEGGRSKLVTACNYPLRRDAEITTHSEHLNHGRKLIIELLYARCPDSELIKSLGERYGADFNRFPAEKLDCVMCGLCVRACERVGGNVLALCGRGVGIHIDTAFAKLGEGCIGCGACSLICPVHAIKVVDRDGYRHIVVHGKEITTVELFKCTSCGKSFGPMIDLSRIMDKAGETKISPPNASVCSDCSRRNLAKRMAERHQEQYESQMVEEG